MTRGGFGFFGLSSVAMVRSPDGLREQVVYLSPESQELIATAVASALVANPSLTAAAIATAIVSNPPGVAQSSDEATLQTSATRASTLSLSDVTNTAGAKGVLLILNVTAVTAVQTLTLNLQVKDPTSGSYATLATTGAIGTTATATGTYTLAVYPGLGSLAAALTSLFGTALVLPYTYRAQIVHSGAGNFTYSLGRVLLR